MSTPTSEITSSRLIANNLTKRYRGRNVVEGLSISLESGEIVGLLGPNGAGKTTSFYMIVGLVRMDFGSILLDGTDISHAPMHARARTGIGYLPQEASVFRKLSVVDNLRAVVGLRHDLDRRARRLLVERLLDEFHLRDIGNATGEQLSGGERRRVEIARALASEPAFMLLDEPFSGVDPISVADIKDQIRDLARRRIGILITDHNVRETLDICDRAYIVNDGHVIAAGDADAILSDQTVRSVYLGERFEL